MTPATDSDRLNVEHMLECIRLVFQYTQCNRDTFFSSRMVQDATLRNLQTMAESSQRLSDTLKTTEPGIPWKQIAGFRNILVHGYLGGIGLPGVWEIIARDLAPLRDALERMYRRLIDNDSKDGRP